MSPIPTGSTITRHPLAVVREVKDLGKAGWGAAQIVRILEKRGVSPVPSYNLVKHWAGGEKKLEEQRRAGARARARKSGGRFPSPPNQPRTDEWKLVRMAELRKAGLSQNDVAIVMAFDRLTKLKWWQVDQSIEAGALPTVDGLEMTNAA